MASATLLREGGLLEKGPKGAACSRAAAGFPVVSSDLVAGTVAVLAALAAVAPWPEQLTLADSEGPVCATACVAAAVVALVAGCALGSGGGGAKQPSALQPRDKAADAQSRRADRFDCYEDPLRWAFVGDGRAHRANVATPVSYESGLCTTKVIAMHRPTHEPWREKTGDYPFAWHLCGRKRIFEIRVQVRLKSLPEGPLYFGVVMNQPRKSSWLGREVRNVFIFAVRRVIGEFYQSLGDDPDEVEGEAEPPTFVMPLWAFDQFIVSDVGQEPDIAGDLAGAGVRRTDGIAAYTRAVKSTIDSFSTDKVYTFCFWGLSQFVDCMNWELLGGFLPFTQGSRFDFAEAGCEPPINVVLYDIPGALPTDKDKRHLVSKKRHLFNVLMWSQTKPPSLDVITRLLGAPVRYEDEGETMQQSKEAEARRPAFSWMLDCCVARTRSST